MQRVYGLVEDDLVHRIDGDATVMGVSRSKWISLAIETFLNRNGDEFTGYHRRESGDTSGDDLNQELEREVTHLKEIISIKDGEIQHLRYLTNDLRSLADNLASKVPALPGPGQNETESEYAGAKTPLWKRLKFWSWV